VALNLSALRFQAVQKPTNGKKSFPLRVMMKQDSNKANLGVSGTTKPSLQGSQLKSLVLLQATYRKLSMASVRPVE